MLIAVEGLRKAGFNSEADNISRQFLTMVLDNYKRDGTIREKYNVVNRTTEANVIGYHENLIGFGWTNGTFLALLHAMPQSEQQAILGTKAAAASAK
jgi:alpha,alpha-trehalase